MDVKKTISKILRIGPDRIAFFSLKKVGIPTKSIWTGLRIARIFAHPYQYAKREEKIKKILDSHPPLLNLPSDTQFLFLAPGTLPGLQDIVEYCKKISEKKKNAIEKFYTQKHALKIEIFSLDEQGKEQRYYDLKEIKPIVEYATSPQMVSIAANYLKEKPILSSVSLIHSSVNDQTVGAQKYHLDKKDHNRIQFFIAISDIDEGCGPFTFIPADISKRVVDKLNYYDGKLPDDTVYQHTPPESAKKLLGTCGSALLINASRCLHYGSRCREKPRIILELHYASRFNPIRDGEDQLSKKLRKRDIIQLIDPYQIIR